MAKRRNSVEWAQWTHAQNQEMLNSMKMEAFASPGRESGAPHGAPSPGGINHEKMSKVLSRKNRTPMSTPQPNLPSREVHSGADTHQFVREESPMMGQSHVHVDEETTYLESEIAQLKDERNLLLEDQSKLIAIIQSDNAKMMDVLNEVKASKQKMIDKIDTLEKERLKLKAFSAEVIENNIESILSSMPLALLSSKKNGAETEEPAEELHSKMVELVSQIRANQADVLQRALSKVELAEKHFIADRMGDVHVIVDQLERVAAGSAGNMQAADALIASAPKALLEVIAERLGDFKKSEEAPINNSHNKKPAKRKNSASGDAKIDNALDMIDAVLAGGGSSHPGDVGWLSGSGTDAKSLLTQNNVLKAGMVLLRKKNSEMRAKVAALSTRKGRQSRRSDRDPSSSPSPDGRRVGHREKSTGNTTNDESEEAGYSVDDDSGDDEDVPKTRSGENKRVSRENARKKKEAEARRMFNSLPTNQQAYIWNILVSTVAEVVEKHPLATSVSLHLKQETVLDVSLQVRELVASILVLPLTEMDAGRGDTNKELPSITQDALYALATRALSSTPVAMEIQVHTNMILAYLFTRFGDTGDGLESEASTYSLPPPTFPVFAQRDAPNAESAAAVEYGDDFMKSSEFTAGSDYHSGDVGSSASSQSSGAGNEGRDYYGYGGEFAAAEYSNYPQTLREPSQRKAPAPAKKPNYMGGTTANKSKRFSVVSPRSGNTGLGDKVAGARAQKSAAGSTRNASNGKNENEFKYYAYRKTSILNHDLPAYNKKR